MAPTENLQGQGISARAGANLATISRQKPNCFQN